MDEYQYIKGARIGTDVGNTLRLFGRYRESLGLHRKCVDVAEKHFMHDNRDLAAHYNNLAVTECESGNQHEARRLLRRASEIMERFLGPNHFELVKFYSNLAMVEQDLGGLSRVPQVDAP